MRGCCLFFVGWWEYRYVICAPVHRLRLMRGRLMTMWIAFFVKCLVRLFRDCAACSERTWMKPFGCKTLNPALESFTVATSGTGKCCS